MCRAPAQSPHSLQADPLPPSVLLPRKELKVHSISEPPPPSMLLFSACLLRVQ